MGFRSWMCVLALVACSGDDLCGEVDAACSVADSVDSDSDTDVDTDTTDSDSGDTADTEIEVPSCADFLSWTPTDGTIDAPRREPVVATFSDIEPSAALTVSLEGTDLVGSTAWDAGAFTFRPVTPFQPGKTYDVSLSWDCGSETMQFTTEGEALDPTLLIGRTYALDITTGTWVAPAGGGAIVGALLQTFTLVQVSGVTTNTLELLIAAGDAGTGEQNLEIATTVQSNVDFSGSPIFTFNGTVALPTPVPAQLQGVAAEGRFTGGGARVEDLRFTGQIDTRPLSTLIGGAPNMVCGLAAGFGYSCTACPGGAGNFCMDIDIRDVVATEVQVPLVTVAATSPTASCSSAPGSSLGALGLLTLLFWRRRRV